MVFHSSFHLTKNGENLHDELMMKIYFIVYFTPKHSVNNIIIQPTMHKHEH